MNTGAKSTDDQARKAAATKDRQILGLSTDELAGLSVDELTGNKTAITMVMHYYKILQDDNVSLRNDLNTAQGYVAGYATKKSNATIGAILLLLANVSIGFGVNLLTSNQLWPGLATFIPGIMMAAGGTYFSTKES